MNLDSHILGRPLLWLLLMLLPGCSLLQPRGVWEAPDLLVPAYVAPVCPLATAEANYSAGLLAKANNDPRCIDYFYAAASQSWTQNVSASGSSLDRGAELYRAAVRQLVMSSARMGRLQATEGLRLGDGRLLPIAYHGFAWTPDEFGSLVPVGQYESELLKHRYVAPGVGVRFVVLSSAANRQPFMRNEQPFAATVVLQPNGAATDGDFRLNFYNPVDLGATVDGAPLERDLTAPIAYTAVNREEPYLRGFLQPGSTGTADGLSMIEPYQRGKIPVVFIHGLLSDPLTWADLANALRANPEISARYQFWAFRYATGEPFFASAAALRRQLVALRQTYDPDRTDPAMSDMVLIGHSLGGLVAKLQVTYSCDTLWREVAVLPLPMIRTDETTRCLLAQSYFFAPSPDVSRVVFIGTPHQGSNDAQQVVGRIASALVEEPAKREAVHDQLMAQNPGVFLPEVTDRIPTSIDLLEPDSKLLQATLCLPYRNGVRLNTILGTGTWLLSAGESDGVVPVSSSQLYGVQSELVLDAKHTELHHRPAAIREVERILLEHAAELPAP